MNRMIAEKKWFVLLLVCAMLFLGSASALGEIVIVTLSDSGCTCESDTVSFADGIVRITTPGEYLFRGSLSNGQICVDCETDGKVILQFEGIQIHSESEAAVLIGHVSPRAHIVLSAGTENTLSTGTARKSDTDEPNGVIFSRSDLTIEGSGKLTVTAGTMDGIVSKDDLRIEGGEISVTAPRHGLRGKDSVEVRDGDITIDAGKDGIRSNNSNDSDRGYISVSGGKIRITCGDDPMDYVTALTVSGGSIDARIVTGDGQDGQELD